MPTKACEDCGERMSDRAAACLKCGRPIAPKPTDNTLQEQFWFAATTVAFNGFILARLIAAPEDLRCTLKIGSSFISFLAFFLVVQRGGNKDYDPGSSSCPGRIRKKLHETWFNIALFPKRLIFLLCESSGSLLYMSFIFVSWLAVFMALSATGKPNQQSQTRDQKQAQQIRDDTGRTISVIPSDGLPVVVNYYLRIDGLPAVKTETKDGTVRP